MQMKIEKDVQMRAFIMDSLIARAGKTLAPAVIRDLAKELLQRVTEVHEQETAQ